MPQDLPGFYFDEEKNRYFPVKGPIPGSKPNNTSTRNRLLSASKLKDNDESRIRVGKRIRSAKLLQERELDGKWLSFNKWKRSFQHEYQKLQITHSTVWKYQGTESLSLTALEQFCVDIQTLEGERKSHALLMGSIDSAISLFKVDNVYEDGHHGMRCMPKCVWPHTSEHKPEHIKAPLPIRRAMGAYTFLPSNVSHIDRVKKHSHTAANDGSCTVAVKGCNLSAENTYNSYDLDLETGYGITKSGASGGSVYALNLREPLDMNQFFHRFDSRTSKIASFTNTVWSADCHPNGTHVAVGMDSGAALVCLERGAVSYVCLSKSDIFSQQFDSSGNVLLCGFRNGAIVPVDVRQKPESVNLATELPKHKIPFSTIRNSNTSDRHGQVFPRKSFQLKAKLMSPGVIFMPSSVCSLVSLYMYDQYFLASSMDGTIKLYDHRMCHRGAVQSYEGHINTHSHLRMGVDPTESFFMSGGEDGFLRLWSIKTGELLFESEIPDTVMSTVCWTGTGRCEKRIERIESLFEEHSHSQPHNWAAWLGSSKGLYYLCGS